jgi:hypothetical protein
MKYEWVMIQTVIGIFDIADQAQNAVNRLMKSGFDRGLIDVSVNETKDGEPSRGKTKEPGEKADDRVSKFFHALFDDEADAYRYLAVANNAASILSVQANSEAEAIRVAQILDESGAVDVDERALAFGNKVLPGPTSVERDDFSGSDAEVSKLAEDELAAEKHPQPVERSDDQPRDVEGHKTRCRIVDGPVPEEMRLREERVGVSGEREKASQASHNF